MCCVVVQVICLIPFLDILHELHETQVVEMSLPDQAVLVEEVLHDRYKLVTIHLVPKVEHVET
jgi:hypothetical protein